jgi:hypothetical protein
MLLNISNYITPYYLHHHKERLKAFLSTSANYFPIYLMLSTTVVAVYLYSHKISLTRDDSTTKLYLDRVNINL